MFATPKTYHICSAAEQQELSSASHQGAMEKVRYLLSCITNLPPYTYSFIYSKLIWCIKSSDNNAMSNRNHLIT